MSSLKIYGNFAFLVTSAVCMARPGSHTTILLSMFPKTGWQCRHKQAKAGSKGWYNVKRDVTSASKRSIRMYAFSASPSDYAVLPPRTLVPDTYMFTVTVSKHGGGTTISSSYTNGDHHRQPAHNLAHCPAAQIQPRPGSHRQR